MEQIIFRQKTKETRALKVILDSALAVLYCVDTKRLNEVVKRNIKRFPTRFHVHTDQRRI